MKVLSSFREAKARLLAPVAFTIIPVALITILLAVAADRALSSGLDRHWRDVTDDAATRTRLWMQGATQTLFATAASLSNMDGSDSRCNSALQDVLSVTHVYKAIRVDVRGEQFCAAAENQDLADLAAEAGENLRSRPRGELTPGTPAAVGVFSGRGQNVLAIQVDSPAASQQEWAATALVDSTMLERAIELTPNAGEIVALIHGRTVVAAIGANASNQDWLPATESNGSGYQIGAARSRNGATFTYATQPVLGSDLYILGRFDNSALQTAWLRFLLLALASLIVLATLYFTYSKAIQSELLQRIDGIKAAMLARRAGSGGPRAPEGDEMPHELRDFAAAFNEMARESAIREQTLKTSLAENEFLLRELNHRVKSSLQIIQSYLSLTRRLDRSTAHQSGFAAMEARVQVLSIAYRKAFSQGRMRDVRIREFAAEIVDNLSQSFRPPGVALELKAEVEAALMIDRAIPFGLALVESVMAGLQAQDAHAVAVRIGELDDLRVELRVSTDGALADGKPNAKLMAGFALQLEASVESPDVGTIVRWRFQAGPPPVLVSGRDAARFVQV